ncbi:MAG: class I SAM-dependent methyltransferase [Ignavibacteriaceae bacterium]|nr:class I SAM-dependent methyltransferase [Ignavibacteriaceae bacterium]
MSIEKSYNSWAEQYDTNENKTRDLDKKATVETLSKYNFENVVELGCGTGKNSEWLITKAKSVIGLDFSEEMLNIAKSKIASNKIRFQITDLKKPWPIENNFADLITCNLTLEHIKDLDFIFNQALQKLKANGKFFVCELHPARQYLGSKAKYETEKGTEELEVYVHHLSDYLDAAKKNSFNLIEINEWFDNRRENEVPRLISFVFNKYGHQ